MSMGRSRWPHYARRSALAYVPDAAKQAVLMGTALTRLVIGGPTHADDPTAATFNRNCIATALTCDHSNLFPALQLPWMHCCAGCHIGGGNVVQAGKTLFTGDLEKNGAGTPEAIYDLVYGGKGKMPGYGAGCQPRVRMHAALSCTCRLARPVDLTLLHGCQGKCTFGPRLSDDEIRRLSAYVLDGAAKDWK